MGPLFQSLILSVLARGSAHLHVGPRGAVAEVDGDGQLQHGLAGLRHATEVVPHLPRPDHRTVQH